MSRRNDEPFNDVAMLNRVGTNANHHDKLDLMYQKLAELSVLSTQIFFINDSKWTEQKHLMLICGEFFWRWKIYDVFRNIHFSSGWKFDMLVCVFLRVWAEIYFKKWSNWIVLYRSDAFAFYLLRVTKIDTSKAEHPLTILIFQFKSAEQPLCRMQFVFYVEQNFYSIIAGAGF